MDPPGDGFIFNMYVTLSGFALSCKADYKALFVFQICLKKVLNPPKEALAHDVGEPPKKRRRTTSENPEGNGLKRFSAEGCDLLPLIETFLLPNINVLPTLKVIVTNYYRMVRYLMSQQSKHH